MIPATYSTSSIIIPLTAAVWCGASILTKIRWVWKKYTRFKPYMDFENIPLILAGHVFRQFIFDYNSLKIFAYFILFTTRLNKLCNQEKIVKQTYTRLVDLTFDTYPLSIPVPEIQDNLFTYVLGKARLSRWIHLASQIAIRTKQIVICTAELYLHLFLLAMRVMDLFDLLFSDSKEREELVDENFPLEVRNVLETLNEFQINKKLIRINLQFLISQINTSMEFIYGQTSALSIETYDHRFLSLVSKIVSFQKEKISFDPFPPTELYALETFTSKPKIIIPSISQLQFQREHDFENPFRSAPPSSEKGFVPEVCL